MQPYRNPGLYADAPSMAVSPWWCWFKDMGYPELDIIDYIDGEWSIIEYQNSPYIPHLTLYKHVLSGMRNIEISWAFCKRYVDQCNPMLPGFWERLSEHEAEQDREFEQRERAAEDRAAAAAKLIVQNPDLMERIARHGMSAMDVMAIRREIPDYKFR